MASQQQKALACVCDHGRCGQCASRAHAHRAHGHGGSHVSGCGCRVHGGQSIGRQQRGYGRDLHKKGDI